MVQVGVSRDRSDDDSDRLTIWRDRIATLQSGYAVIRVGRRVLYHPRRTAKIPPSEVGAVATGDSAMSVTVRPYRTGGWEADITFRLPNSVMHRDRRAPQPGSVLQNAGERTGNGIC